MTLRARTRVFLVGGQRTFPDGSAAEERMRFLGDLFQRLLPEVAHTGDVTRYMSFQGRLEGQGEFEFFGIEVDRVASLPRGMVAWELDDSRLRIRSAQDPPSPGDRGIEIRWDWRERAPHGPRPWVGEFSVPGRAGGLPARLLLCANAYAGRTVADAASDAIVIADYDPAWPREFARFAPWLQEALGADIALRVEHYGSTAIPGMPAKPVVDVLVDIPSFEQARPRVLSRLNDPRWEYWWYEDHFTFIRRNRLMGERTHHVHMAPRGHPLWQGIAFRDYLRTHAADASAYAELKRALAASHGEDRERYTAAKTAFVREIVRKAGGAPGRAAHRRGRRPAPGAAILILHLQQDRRPSKRARNGPWRVVQNENLLPRRKLRTAAPGGPRVDTGASAGTRMHADVL